MKDPERAVAENYQADLVLIGTDDMEVGRDGQELRATSGLHLYC